jgi:hypothetical protein
MQTSREAPRWSDDLCADFCGAVEGYAVTGEATKELDQLCGKLWNCTDILPQIACDDTQVPVGSTYAYAAQAMRLVIRRRRAHGGRQQ